MGLCQGEEILEGKQNKSKGSTVEKSFFNYQKQLNNQLKMGKIVSIDISSQKKK